MNLYAYQATDLYGRSVSGKIKANNEQELYELLREENLYCSQFARVEAKAVKAKYRFKVKELSFICRQLASMLNSGINIVKAIYILMSQEENAKAKDVLREIYEEVQRGRSFSEALETQEGAFPALFIRMVSAGEASGGLDMIMNRVADHYAKENKLNNTVKKAMVYPIILGIIMLLVVVLLFTMVMPTFTGMFANPDEIPPATQFVMAISDFMIGYWYIIIAVVVGLVVFVRAALKIKSVRFAVDKAKCRMPKIGDLVCTVYLARFARTMSNLFASGLPMVDCLMESEGTLNNAYISRCFEDVIEDVKSGESVSSAIAKVGVFNAVFTSTLYIGEESGKIDEILDKSADFYDEEADTAIQNLVAMVEPLMIVVMGGMVMLVLSGVFPAMYGSFESLGI